MSLFLSLSVSLCVSLTLFVSFFLCFCPLYFLSVSLPFTLYVPLFSICLSPSSLSLCLSFRPLSTSLSLFLLSLPLTLSSSVYVGLVRFQVHIGEGNSCCKLLPGAPGCLSTDVSGQSDIRHTYNTLIEMHALTSINTTICIICFCGFFNSSDAQCGTSYELEDNHRQLQELQAGWSQSPM